MENQLKAKAVFNEKLELLSKQEQSAHYSNTNPLIVLYAKLIEVEKKLDELNKK
jgi:hypothetical protein